MKLLKNYFWNVSYQLFSIIVPIIIVPYINRTLGTNGVGINSYTLSLTQVFIIIGDLGFANYGTKLISSNKKDKLKISRIFFEIVLTRALTIIFSYGLFIIFVIHGGIYEKFYFIQGIVILSSVIDFSWFFMGMEEFKTISIRNFGVRILSVIMIFIFVKNSNDLYIYICINALSGLIGNLFIIKPLLKNIIYTNIFLSNILDHLKHAIIFFIPQISMQIYQTFYKFILGNIINVKASGFFDNSDKIIYLVLTLLSSLSSVMLPHISNLYSVAKKSTVKEYFYKYFDIMLFLSFPITFGLCSISIKFAPWFFGYDFKIVGKLIFIESFSIIPISIGLSLSSYFISTNQINKYNIAILYGAILNSTLGIYFIFRFGLIGSMWGTVVTECFISTYELFILRKQLLIKKMFTNVFYYFISSIILFIIVFFSNFIMKFNIWTFFVQIFLGIIVYIIMIFITQPTIIKDNKNILQKIIKKVGF